MNTPVRLMLILAMILTGLGFPYGATPVSAEISPPFLDETPPPPQAPLAENTVYLPLTINLASFVVRGQVANSSGQPVAGVIVADDSGQTAVTNNAGEYVLAVDSGEASLAPSKSGFMFSPSVIDLDVSGDVNDQDFIAVSADDELVTNGGFESTTWWNTPTSGVPAMYTNALAHSGSRSMRTGITNAAYNELAESRVRSPNLTIPNNATSAELRLWLYPVTSESPLTAIEKTDSSDEAASPDVPGPSDAAFGDATLLYDAQYVRVLNAADNTLLGTLLYIRSGNAYWSMHQFDLLPFKGRAIRLEMGAYNDGTDGVTALYIDDVSLAVHTDGPEPPPPPEADACANQVANSGFEYNGSWHLPYTPYPAGYTYNAAYTGVRSMRTGIPFSTYSNVESYSDAWQTVYIPPGMTSVRLKMRLYPRAEGLAQSAPEVDAEGLAPEEQVAPEALPADAPDEGVLWNEAALAPDAPDAQYVLLLNPTTGLIMRTLEWWSPRNAGGWLYREYDLSAYAGRYVRIQFGTYNNGWGSRALMYVDDVRVTACSTPPPPPVCSQRITNGGFENNSGWYIPYTAFSAGYSSYRSYSGVRSMRTGIVYNYHNRYSYSDFRQTISIPVGMSSARLHFYAYSTSGETYAAAPPSSNPQLAPEVAAQVTTEEAAQLAAAALVAERPTAAEAGAEAMSGDVQYVLVLDRYGNWIDTLMWRRSNERYWRYFTFNLDRYIGSTIMLQWGTYNNGYSGVTSMYVDNVSLQACP